MSALKRLLYRSLSLESYLRLLQRSFFIMYRTGLLKGKPEFANHYYIRELVGSGDTVIDIGANLGYYSIPLSRLVGASGRVYAVEPVGVYNRVFNRAARRRRNIELLPYALGDEEKEVTLVNSPKEGYLQTGLPHIYDRQADGVLEDQQFIFSAQMKRPSQLFAGLDRLDYVKCDIEGFEYTVLHDMQGILSRFRPIVQVEVWEQNETPLREMFADMGYSAFRLQDGKLTPCSECRPGTDGDFIFIADMQRA